MKTGWFTIPEVMHQLASSTRIWITSGLSLSAGNGLAYFTRTSIPSRAFPLALSCTKGFYLQSSSKLLVYFSQSKQAVLIDYDTQALHPL